MVSLALPIAFAEWIFNVTGSPYSVADGLGAGQIVPLVIILIAIPIFSRFVARDEPFGFLFHYAAHWRRSLAGFVFFAVITFVVCMIGYAALIGLGQVSFRDAQLALFTPDKIIQLFILCLIGTVVALTEEIMFRSFLFRYLRTNATFVTTAGAILFSSIVFAVLHNAAEPRAWLLDSRWQLFAGLFMLGVLLCVTYVCTRSLTCGIGLHAALIYTEIIRMDTLIILFTPEPAWWMTPNFDIRFAPILWLLFLITTIIIVRNRAWLRSKFAIEPEIMHHGLLIARRDAEQT